MEENINVFCNLTNVEATFGLDVAEQEWDW